MADAVSIPQTFFAYYCGDRLIAIIVIVMQWRKVRELRVMNFP
jgi:hypothetical protein